MIGPEDTLVALGLLLLGLAIWLAWGVAPLVAYVGIVLVMAGLVLTWMQRGR